MQYPINRYSLTKELITTGTLTIIDEGNAIELVYVDSVIKESARELHHPLTALESLRKTLETKHCSLLNCNGCRIDTAYRATGVSEVYLIEDGKRATKSVDMFEPTKEIAKLCTVEEHELAYDKWLDSLK